MELPIELELLPVQQLEPIPSSSLAPYLNNMDSNLDSFAQLADQLLRAQSAQAHSPAPSDHSSCQHQLYSSSSSSSSSCSWSCSSSGPGSVASSACLSSAPSSPGACRPRRRGGQNAHAAKKYRRKLKGRDQGLEEQVEREEARNRQLRAKLDAKLALYREFVTLLVTKLGPGDGELASLGSNSLNTIMSEVLVGSHGDQEMELELAGQLSRLQHLQTSNNYQSYQSPPEPLDSRLVYDFYSDSFRDTAIQGPLAVS